MNQHRVEVQFPPDVAFGRVQKAFQRVGRVRNVYDGTRSVRGWMRTGLGGQTINVSVLTGAEGTSSVIEFQGQGAADPYGYLRRAFERLIEAIAAADEEPPAATNFEARVKRWWHTGQA